MLKNANENLLVREMMVHENGHVFIGCHFDFIRGHMGLRPGDMHTLLGAAGSGKSTLVRAIIRSVAEEHRILVWLSEEGRNDLILALTQANVPSNILENIYIYSEVDEPPPRDFEMYKLRMEEMILALNPSVVFFDNITTCQTYESNGYQGQGTFLMWLKTFTKKRQFALFVVAHTGSSIKENQNALVDQNDIRGSRDIANKSEYFYVYQRIRMKDSFFSFVRVQKSRKHSLDGIFVLTFHYPTRTFIRDKKIDWETFKKNFKERATL